MAFIGTGINNSATIAAKAAADITDGAFKAVKLTAEGVVLADAGDIPIGVLVSETESPKAGEEVSVQVKDIGYVTVGAAVETGDLLASGADGKLVKAASGKFVLAQALEAAAQADCVIAAQICKAGYAS